MERKDILKLPYFLMIKNINKAVAISAIIAGVFSKIVNTGELISKDVEMNNS
ncbi:MAG TPA: hypothetical protein VF354_04060 [Candidatus Methanoperedens sp.]